MGLSAAAWGGGAYEGDGTEEAMECFGEVLKSKGKATVGFALALGVWGIGYRAIWVFNLLGRGLLPWHDKTKMAAFHFTICMDLVLRYWSCARCFEKSESREYHCLFRPSRL